MFTNVGHTCYLSAALVALLHTPCLVAYAVSEAAWDDMFRKRANACAAAEQFLRFAELRWKEFDWDTPLDPEKLLTALGKIHRPFSRRVPGHDAHQALAVVLDVLHTSWGRTPLLQPPEIAAKNAAFQTFINRHGYSMVTEIFVVQTLANGIYDHAYGLSVTGTAKTLQGCLRDVHITAFPLVLVLHFQEMGCFVEYPDALDLDGHRYALYSVVCLVNGHYTCFASRNDTWYRYDDTKITPVTDVEEIITKNAYVVLYKRKV